MPDTLQALIAARIDHLDPAAKTLLQRGAVVGRVFWRGALEHLAPDVEGHEALVDDLLQREFLLREPRSSISGEVAYRFKHALIREVAYTGMAKLARAQYHARFAEWLAERTGEELVEIRAYHLDQAVEFLTELEGAPPEELAQETAAALVKAAKRAIAREAYGNARKLGLRALELRPTLGARYVAARAAWRLQDFAAVQVEMEKVREQAHEHDERVVEALALTALGEAALKRDGDPDRAQELVDEALEILAKEDDPVAHFDALTVRAIIGGWHGRHGRGSSATWSAPTPSRSTRDGRTCRRSPRSRSRRRTSCGSSSTRRSSCSTRALELAGESGSVRARISAHRSSYGWFLAVKGELDAAETVFEEVRDDRRGARDRAGPRGSAAEARLASHAPGRPQAGGEASSRGASHHLGARRSRAAARLPGGARRRRSPISARSTRPSASRSRLAATPGPRHALPDLRDRPRSAAVRAAQGRDDEAEELFGSALELGAGERLRACSSSSRSSG